MYDGCASGDSLYNYFRDYDPSIGRYIESDPLGLRGGINTYAYVGNSPQVRQDPLGLCDNDYSCHYVCFSAPTALVATCDRVECRNGKCKTTNVGMYEMLGKAFNFVGKIECKAFEKMERDERNRRGLGPRWRDVI